MLNRSASLAMTTSVLKALPGKLDIKRHPPSILYLQDVHELNTHEPQVLDWKVHLMNYPSRPSFDLFLSFLK